MHIIYGGTFDPIHNGHLRVAIELREMLGVNRIDLVPCHIPPHRGDPGGSSEHRLELLKLAVAEEPGLGVDDRELVRGGSSYTADTLRHLRDELGPDEPLVMVLGTDSFSGFDRWQEWSVIPELAHIILVSRPGPGLAPDSMPSRLLSERWVSDIALLHTAPAGCILEVEPPLLDISATGIRERLVTGRSARYLVPDAVLARIDELGLYGRNGNEHRG
ncbi:nicotinate-nucleotide adenylyltransferase [Marinobacter bryozoorum]|uniref:nicotinate-nucleotide adenylyltransferase n=1 Tax=Marinobacter bryozoorum TaxID=256324 RepID=UPI0020050AD9|nr:nicotinate-nucleotide adenylyltransferase [Marinobacter bryozoorum]MCK7543904.1 nicotinate-nucleotide adenylyltransferase [Marinobacter bryozoorum]